MARVFITGSSDGLGQLAANELAGQGHKIIIHARNESRADEAMAKVPGAEAVVTADLSSIEGALELAEKASALGDFDAVIHNAAVYTAPPADIFTVNTLAPYILTSLMAPPARLVYMSSGMHQDGRARLDELLLDFEHVTYSDSKLHVVMLAKAVARKWPGVYSNAVDPGWVPTKMGGPGAPDSFQSGYETQVWLAVSADERARVTGRYFHHLKEERPNPQSDDEQLQEKLLDVCAELTGVPFPDRTREHLAANT